MGNAMEKPFHVVLYQPVIPQNTGSIARLCACTGAVLHLIHPLGFQTDEAKVKRAGLDYWEHVDIREHASWEAFLDAEAPQELYFFSKKAHHPFTQVSYPRGCYLVLGSETSGLPESWFDKHPGRFLQIPMRTDLVRSLNLAQAAALVLYEGLRQHNYPGI
jgi:tRNA (cytidine/uridine-2'-O-)-methyltransferase